MAHGSWLWGLGCGADGFPHVLLTQMRSQNKTAGEAELITHMISDVSHHIAVLYVSVHIPASQSLKDKRMVLRSVKDRVRKNFNVSISEIDGQDKWQTALLAFAMIGTDNRHVDSTLQNLLSHLGRYHSFDICDHQIEFY